MHSPFSLSLQIRFFISNFLTLRSHLWSSNSLNFFQMYSVYWCAWAWETCIVIAGSRQVSGWRNTQCKQHRLQLNCFSTKKRANTFVLVYTACQSSISFPEELKDWTHQTQPTFATRVVWRMVMDFPQQILPKALSWELQPDVQTLDTDTPRLSSSTPKAGFMQIFLNNIAL